MSDILKKIKNSTDVKNLSDNQREILCDEMREEIISTVSNNGGHLASNLGVVELSVALHTVFNLPDDKIIWDVGHQCYCHKMLTGRYDEFKTIRQEKGLSGFPNREESEYDTFTTGHSSTSISSAFGIATANSIIGNNNKVVAVIGDGALSGGLAFEGLNNAGRFKKNFIVILNDNNMSISKNVGSLARHLSFLRVNLGYIKAKTKFENLLKKLPFIGKFFQKIFSGSKKFFKHIFYNPTIFESLGFSYYGPYDGHDLEGLIEVLSSVKYINKPIVVHIKTTKGKGYERAEDNPKDFHGVPKFNPVTGKFALSGNSFSTVFGNSLVNLALKNDKICAITAAMSTGTGLQAFEKNFKNRFFDSGIAEAHAVTFSAGLARQGLIPVFAVYSTFLKRAYDSLIHDIALQDLKVIFAVDRAGFVGDDGKTHQGLFDVSFLKTVPNITIFSPSFFEELDLSLKKVVEGDYKACAIRYPRGSEGYRPKDFKVSNDDFDIYGEVNSDTCVICYGRVFSNSCIALEKIEEKFTIVKFNKIYPINLEALKKIKNYKNIIILEEASKGIANDIASELLKIGFSGKCKIFDVKNPFVTHARMEVQMQINKLDENSIIKEINLIREEDNSGR